MATRSLENSLRTVRINLLHQQRFAYSEIRWFWDHTIAILTGMSLLVCKLRVTLALFPGCLFCGWTVSWYWGFIMNVGYVQLPPAVFEVKDPSSYDDKNKPMICQDYSKLQYRRYVGRCRLVLYPCDFGWIFCIHGYGESYFSSVTIIGCWYAQYSWSLRYWNTPSCLDIWWATDLNCVGNNLGHTKMCVLFVYVPY